MNELLGIVNGIRGNQAQFRIQNIPDLKVNIAEGVQEYRIIPVSGMITSQQRKKAYALIGEIARATGYLTNYQKERLKYQLKEEYTKSVGKEMFSLSYCSENTALAFIDFLVDKALEVGAQIEPETLNSLDTEQYVKMCLKYRVCTVCGRRDAVQINHEDTVGMGNDRTHIDHRGHRLEALCVEHHAEFHAIGAKSFAEKYHFHGVKLNTKEVISLGLMSKRQCEEFDGRS
ncbi:putative HNHc nuclease [Ligilactobacillus equi]|uniref:HNHc nuclease n=1 Tax=Ligilactobacillus equi DPC 6820 TaxID=1392007 RepID=V7HYF7_9LACO|nr:putative HNHc nuclease [Ligilactobacillus equi]ETA74066.1 hypothetical protein LEQ_1526c [Ligilactobacillus equi DPC 6820]